MQFTKGERHSDGVRGRLVRTRGPHPNPPPYNADWGQSDRGREKNRAPRARPLPPPWLPGGTAIPMARGGALSPSRVSHKLLWHS